MKDAASTAQREQNQRQGLIVGTITLPFRLLGVLIGSLLFSIVIECIGMHLFWKDQGWQHSQQMLQVRAGAPVQAFHAQRGRAGAGRTAHELVDTGYEWVFVRSGLLERMSQTAERARAPSQGQARNFRYFISQVYVWAESYLIAAAFTTLTFLVRLLVLVLTLPLIFTAAFVGLIDGLVRRDVAPVRRGPGIRLYLPPSKSQSDAAGRAALGHVPGLADLGASAADPAAQRRLAGTGREPDCREFQEVPVIESPYENAQLQRSGILALTSCHWLLPISMPIY